MYQFSVKDASEVDIQRICRECQEDENAEAILVTSQNALLLLRQDFLDKFNRADSQVVCSECLHPDWGKAGVDVFQKGQDGVQFNVPFAFYGHTFLSGWRGRSFPLDTASAVVNQLLAARKYKKNLLVKVHVI